MKRIVLIFFSVIFLTSCSSSSAIQATTIPAASPIPATDTPSPTNTVAPTNTPKPTATFPPVTPTRDGSEALAMLTSYLKQFNVKDLEVIDVRYEDGERGSRTILHVEAKNLATPFDSSSSGSLVGLIAGVTKREDIFDSGIYALNIIIRDSQMNPRQTIVAKWQDVLDFGTGKLTSDQFVTRLTITP